MIEKIDSRTIGGSNAYIWLIKSPNVVTQDLNEPPRYSFGLVPGGSISVDLNFDIWNISAESSSNINGSNDWIPFFGVSLTKLQESDNSSNNLEGITFFDNVNEYSIPKKRESMNNNLSNDNYITYIEDNINNDKYESNILNKDSEHKLHLNLTRRPYRDIYHFGKLKMQEKDILNSLSRHNESNKEANITSNELTNSNFNFTYENKILNDNFKTKTYKQFLDRKNSSFNKEKSDVVCKNQMSNSSSIIPQLLNNEHISSRSSSKYKHIKSVKPSSVHSFVPLCSIPKSCLITLKSDELNSLTCGLHLINLDVQEMTTSFLQKVNKLIENVIKRGLTYWNPIIRVIIKGPIHTYFRNKCIEVIEKELSMGNQTNKIDSNLKISKMNGSFTETTRLIPKLSMALSSILFNKQSVSNSSYIDVFFKDLPLYENYKDQLTTMTLQNVYLLLLNSEQLAALSHSSLHELALLSFSSYPPYYIVSTYLRSTLRVPVKNSKIQINFVSSILDRYTILVVNGDRVPLSITGSINIQNPSPLNHLSFEKRRETFILDTMLTLYFLVWVAYLLDFVYSLGFRLRNMNNVNTLHSTLQWSSLQLLSMVILLLKPICILFDKYNLVNYCIYGELSMLAWSVPRVLSRSFDTLLLLYLLLISLGWKVLRDNLLTLETRFVTAICIISLYLGIFEITISAFQIARYILHALSYLCIIIATNINTSLLNHTISDQNISPRLGVLYKKWQSYIYFRWIFICSIIKPSILLFYRIGILQPNGFDDWIYTLIDYLSDFILLNVIIYLFRPFEVPELFKHLHVNSQSDYSNISTSFEMPIWTTTL
ncbi:hypothetical protein cand_021650 [Cryptosporidium andersoni]|uniref:Uncharacterized protein n=1 Tax=Cryptosporidium andersoni TaxID=117008 RepID=A0A1J4MSY8_9CRYT|nr:hypothetical protein cand_021650 [Cryptosporidium andersoni]